MLSSAFKNSRLLVLAAVALIADGGEPAQAQRKPREEREVLRPAPPQPVEQAVRVKRGAKVEIPLRIYGRQGERVRYLIRSQPEHGKLTEPAAVANDAAVVTYTPPVDLTVTGDKFTYAAGGALGVSAAAEVAITIVDDPPLLIVPEALDFPAVLAGAQTVKELEIANEGGGRIEGELQVEAPWKIAGARAYRLSAGERQSFRVVFAPATPGEYRSEARFTTRRDRTTVLRAECLAVVAIDPADLELRHAFSDPARQADFTLTNRTDEERVLTFAAASERLQLPPRVTLPPRGQAKLTARLAPSDVAALREEFRIEGAGAAIRVPVKAAIVGPILSVAAQTISFGRIPPGQPARAAVELANAGGTEGFWKWEVPTPFAAEPAELKLQPGEKRSAHLVLSSAPPGRYRGWAKIRGEQQAFELLVEAEVAAAATAAAPAKSPRSALRRVSSAARAAVPDAPARETPATANDAFLRRAAQQHGIRVREVARTSAMLDWPAAISPAKDYRIHIRQLSLGPNRELKVDWAELRTVRLRVEGDRVVAELSKIAPGTPHAVRVSPMLTASEPGPPLFTADFTTPPARRWSETVTPLRALFVALAICLGLLAWRKFRPTPAAD